MKTTGFPLLIIFLLFPHAGQSRELYSIGIGRDDRAFEIVLGEYRDGVWVETTFPPAAGFDGNFSPALAISPSGELWAAWAAWLEGEEPKIYFSRQRGESWTEPRRVTTGDDQWEMTPALAFGPDGTLLAAWSGERADNSKIYCARWENDGFSPPTALSSPDLSPALHPALAIDSDDSAVVVWQGWDGGYFQIFYSLYDGRNWSEGKNPARRAGIDQVLPFVLSPREGGWECFWLERGELFSAAVGKKGQNGPAPARAVSAKSLAGGEEPPVTGWVVEKDRGGNTRARRVGILVDPDLGTTARTARAGLGNRVYIGYGDSITYGTDGPPMGKCYIPILEAELEAAHSEDYTIYNHGYPGCDTSQLLTGGGYQIRPCPGINAVVNYYDASHILIMAGTNDYSHGFSPSFSKDCLGAMIDRARAGDCEPVLATIIPCCQSFGFYQWTEILSRDYIVPLAREKNCLLADPFGTFLSYGPYNVWNNFLVEDCQHPVWTEGSWVIADAWFAALSDPESTLPLLDSGDYDGNGRADIALFRPASGLWAAREVTRVYFGSASDIPASGDYDNDGTTDIAVFRASNGLWAVRGVTRVYFGRIGDIAAPGDYDGDGFCQPAVFRESNGLWAVRGVDREYFGTQGDIPVPAYYGGNRVKNVAVFRPATGLWAVRGLTRFYFGKSGDQPVPADYGGDGTVDPALFRPASGLWAVQGLSRYYFGAGSDQPRPAPYDGAAAIGAVFRESSGLWALRGSSRVYFGTAGDIPVSGRIPHPLTPTPTRTPIPSPSPSPTPTRTPIPSPSPSPTPTRTPIPSPSPFPTSAI